MYSLYASTVKNVQKNPFDTVSKGKDEMTFRLILRALYVV